MVSHCLNNSSEVESTSSNTCFGIGILYADALMDTMILSNSLSVSSLMQFQNLNIACCDANDTDIWADTNSGDLCDVIILFKLAQKLVVTYFLRFYILITPFLKIFSKD